MNVSAHTKKRCAIYTRKSTEEGLNQEFNSLHAQREACEAYVESQKNEGWHLLPDAFDDGGFSGGNMDRPALKRLIADIEADKIDIVLVYKVDRLSRSLADFAKLVELFDSHKVSFVSITQQFNTTTSMGRLTLNILLSFAQFEREVSSERIRDKVAASKKKGMWMGGSLPLGYDVKDRQLQIIPQEAKQVKTVFDCFLMTQSVTLLVKEVRAMGIHSKARYSKTGKKLGGCLLNKSSLYRMLNNPIYAGKIHHQGELYDGRHKAIISMQTWQQAQSILKTSPRDKSIATKRRTRAVLTGILKCGGCGKAMTPCHTVKKAGKFYRYYRASNYIKAACQNCPIKQVSANEIESLVLQQLQTIFAAPEMIIDTWKAVAKEDKDSKVTDMQVREALQDIFPIWEELFPAEQQRLLELMLSKVVVHADHVDVQVRVNGLESLVHQLNQHSQRLTEVKSCR